MGKVGCRADSKIAKLAEYISKNYGKDLDQGYQVLKTKRTSPDEIKVEYNLELSGKKDGCRSKREVLNCALEIATDEILLTCGDQSEIAHLLATDHNVNPPWFAYNKANQMVNIKSEAIKIETATSKAGYIKDTPEYIRELGKRIFQSDKMQNTDPHLRVYPVFGAMKAAGLNVSFVAIPIKLEILPPSTHVALSIELGNGQKVIADPAHGVYDVKGVQALPLDLTQALSLYHTSLANINVDSKRNIDIALKINPYNWKAKAWGIFGSTHHIIKQARYHLTKAKLSK